MCALTTLTVLQWQVTVMQYITQNNKNRWNHIPKTPLAWKKASKKGHFAHIGNEIKICSQNKCHHHLSNVCENSFRMFHSNWVISDYHSFVWQFEFPWLNLTNCPDVGKVMMTFLSAADFDFIAYMSKMGFFESFFHANGVFGIWSYFLNKIDNILLYCFHIVYYDRNNVLQKKLWVNLTSVNLSWILLPCPSTPLPFPPPPPPPRPFFFLFFFLFWLWMGRWPTQ